MNLTPSGRGLGWRPQKPDHRDVLYSSPRPPGALPQQVDLRLQMPPVYDQGHLGSCTGNAIAGAIHFDRMKQGLQTPAPPSRLMIYYMEREIEHTIRYDAGAEIRDGIKAVARNGTCFEDKWPYDEGRFAQRPDASCYAAAAKDRAVKYMAVAQIAQQLRGCLAEGYPFIFGFTCYPGLDSADVAQHGLLPMPAPGEAPIGGHAVLAVGYEDAARHFIIRNSWGPAWGDKGYFYMPYEYVQRPDLTSDIWTIRLVG